MRNLLRLNFGACNTRCTLAVLAWRVRVLKTSAQPQQRKTHSKHPRRAVLQMKQAGLRRPVSLSDIYCPLTKYGITVVVFEEAAGVCTLRLKLPNTGA